MFFTKLCYECVSPSVIKSVCFYIFGIIREEGTVFYLLDVKERETGVETAKIAAVVWIFATKTTERTTTTTTHTYTHNMSRVSHIHHNDTDMCTASTRTIY